MPVPIPSPTPPPDPGPCDVPEVGTPSSDPTWNANPDASGFASSAIACGGETSSSGCVVVATGLATGSVMESRPGARARGTGARWRLPPPPPPPPGPGRTGSIRTTSLGVSPRVRAARSERVSGVGALEAPARARRAVNTAAWNRSDAAPNAAGASMPSCSGSRGEGRARNSSPGSTPDEGSEEPVARATPTSARVTGKSVGPITLVRTALRLGPVMAIWMATRMPVEPSDRFRHFVKVGTVNYAAVEPGLVVVSALFSQPLRQSCTEQCKGVCKVHGANIRSAHMNGDDCMAAGLAAPAADRVRLPPAVCFQTAAPPLSGNDHPDQRCQAASRAGYRAKLA